MTKTIDGKKLSQSILVQIANEVAKTGKQIGLSVILIGDDPSSHLYVRLKKQACEECGIEFHKYLFEKDYTTKDIIDCINFLNKDPETTGILVQLPLPKGFDTAEIIKAIDPKKDADGFHPTTLANNENCQINIVSPLIAGIAELIKETKEEIKNKNIVILCNNKIFGKPFHCFFDNSNTIEIVTTKDQDYKKTIANADILVVSIGQANFITKEMIKQDVILIDVGINQLADGTIAGDVDFEDIQGKASFITPVPGGVGPMTIAMLLKNLLNLSK